MAEGSESVENEIAAAVEPEPLGADVLRWRCDPNTLGFVSTAEVEPLHGVIGQDTAVDALRFGLEINAPGQNIFVRGLAGTGRMTLIRRMLEQTQVSCPRTKACCYVHNFEQPDRPSLITLPRGKGQHFRQCIQTLADFIRDDLRGALASEPLQARKTALGQNAATKISALTTPFEESLKEVGLALVSIQVGSTTQAAIFPLVDDKPVPPEEWESLCASGKISEDSAKEVRDRRSTFEKQLQTIMQQVNEIQREHAQQDRSLLEEAVRSILGEMVGKITAEFDDARVRTFLDKVVNDVAVNRIHTKEEDEDYSRQYCVNVVMSHPTAGGCPIVVENTPTMSHLLGTIDLKFERDEPSPADHMTIRAGSLLQADGGYLIIEARDVLREPGAWNVLVRTLKTGKLEITPPDMESQWRAVTLKPEPIDVNIKVILLGGAETYYLLDSQDPDFPHLFKVLADFDSEIPRSAESISDYGRVLARIAAEEKLPPFANTAVAALVEHGARIASRKDRLTTRFGRLADIAREAAFITTKQSRPMVTGVDVVNAIHNSKVRANLPSKHFLDLLASGTIRVATRGMAVGQVNGLAVISAGPLTYGFPTRITSTIGPGSAGVINIEREADLSGAIHTKGFYILSGLLRYLMRTEHPLAFHASVAFEQSYGGIDGDSASAAEICCLLSALTDLPLRQDMAITGAIDQVGNILPVGATNEKIEGFFDTCSQIGLTGTQGVIVPQANARDLMLREDVVEACVGGKFRVYGVDRIHEALELLTGFAAGERGADGEYPENSLLGVAVARAFEFWLKSSPGVEAFEDKKDEEGMKG